MRQAHEFERKQIQPGSDAPDATYEIVIADDCRNGRGQPCGGGDQRLGDSRRHGPQIGGARRPDSNEGIDDAPNRPEEADKWRHASSRGQKDKVTL